MNIYFNQTDVEQIAASFKTRLSETVKKAPHQYMSIEEFQRWTEQHNIATPELLSRALKKNRDRDESRSKLMSEMQQTIKVSR